MAVNKSRVLSKVRRGGFAASLSGALNDRASFLRDTFQSQSKYLQEEGLKRRSKIKGLQAGFKEAADFLDDNGMDKGKVSKLIQSDPDAFLKFAQKAMKYQESGETLTSDLLNDAHDFSEDSSYKDVTPQSAIEMMLPIYNTSSDPVVREKKTFLASLGADLFQPAATVANRQIERASILGTTGGDIMSSLGEPLYKSGSGGVVTDYSGFKKISSIEINSDRTRMIDEYDQLLAGKIRSLPAAEATRLQKEYDGLPDSSRLEKLILDPMFGPEIAHKYNQKSKDIAARFLIGDKAFDAVTNYEVPSEETSGGLMERPTSEIEVTELPPANLLPPTETTTHTENRFTLHYNEKGDVIFLEGPELSTNNPEVIKKYIKETNPPTLKEINKDAERQKTSSAPRVMNLPEDFKPTEFKKVLTDEGGFSGQYLYTDKNGTQYISPEIPQRFGFEVN